MTEGLLKELVLAQLTEGEKPVQPTGPSPAVLLRREEEMGRRYCLELAFQIMSDEKNNAGMNYTFKDMVAVAEQIRAYVEEGEYVNETRAFEAVPQEELDQFQTLGS